MAKERFFIFTPQAPLDGRSPHEENIYHRFRQGTGKFQPPSTAGWTKKTPAFSSRRERQAPLNLPPENPGCRPAGLPGRTPPEAYRRYKKSPAPGKESRACRMENKRKRAANECLRLLLADWCPGGDSNSHAIRRYHLKIVCLPIPPPGHSCFCIRKTPTWQVFFFRLFSFFEYRAG